jgi:hypothetical protein
MTEPTEYCAWCFHPPHPDKVCNHPVRYRGRLRGYCACPKYYPCTLETFPQVRAQLEMDMASKSNP